MTHRLAHPSISHPAKSDAGQARRSGRPDTKRPAWSAKPPSAPGLPPDLKRIRRIALLQFEDGRIEHPAQLRASLAALYRHAKIEEQAADGPVASSFGLPRNAVKDKRAQQKSITPDGRNARYLRYFQDFVSDRARPGQGFYQATADIDGKSVPLTGYIAWPDKAHPEKSRVELVFPDAKHIATVLNHIDARVARELPELQKAKKTPETLRRALALVADTHWLHAQAHPYFNGSAAIADMYAKSLMDLLGITHGAYQAGIDPDLEALSHTQADFRKNFHRLFETPPRFQKTLTA